MTDPLTVQVDNCSPSPVGVVKRFLSIFLPMLGVLVVSLSLVFLRDRQRDHRQMQQRSLDVTRLQASMVARDLEAVTALLLHFAEQDCLQDFLVDPAERESIELEYQRFCKVSGMFDQLRLIDEEGLEFLRVNYNSGEPRRVPLAELQPKQDRYYFRQTRTLERGQIYVSQFDLNAEHGEIERPFKPVIRIATPIFDRKGRRRGILIGNYLGAALLERLEMVASQVPGASYLVNSEGYYLDGPDDQRSWGFMFDLGPTFALDHPIAWEAIQGNGKGIIETADGVFSFQSISPDGRSLVSPADFSIDNKVVSFVPTDLVYEASWHTFLRLAVGASLAALVLFGVAWRLAFVGALREEHERDLASSERRLRVLSSRLLDAQETERKSLARDLHDEVGQLATAVTISLKRARKAAALDAKDTLIEESVEGIGQLLDSMHQISSRIRSSILDDLGLTAALESLTEGFERSTGIPVHATLRIDQERIPERVAENAYRIIQEAMTNVSRHAQAESVQLHVEQDEIRLALTVRDHGVGIDPDGVDLGRIGLLGMRERAELLGGSFNISSSPRDGTCVEAVIPLNLPDHLH